MQGDITILVKRLLTEYDINNINIIDYMHGDTINMLNKISFVECYVKSIYNNEERPRPIGSMYEYHIICGDNSFHSTVDRFNIPKSTELKLIECSRHRMTLEDEHTPDYVIRMMRDVINSVNEFCKYRSNSCIKKS